MLSMLAEAGSYLNYSELGLDPVALDLGFFQLRWYSLAYLAGILVGYWYLTKLVDAPGAPMLSLKSPPTKCFDVRRRRVKEAKR